MSTSVEEIMLAGRGGRLAYVQALERLLGEGRPMWSFSYTGRGFGSNPEAPARAASEARVNEEINAAAEKQLKDTPERAHPYIRAAQEYVKRVAGATDRQVSIVAEGWVEEDGHAGSTINVSVAPA